MRILSTAALAAALALTAAIPNAGAAKPKGGGAAPAPPPSSSLELKVVRDTLANGLVILLHEDHSVPAVTFWQWYRVGSRNEYPGITGISHYFEHMMFNGSKHVPPKEYDRILESNGGYSNAFTDRDMTAYYEDLASDRLGVALFLDSDRMAALSLLPEQLASEIGVVKEERRLRTDNDIFGMLDEQLWATAFNASTYRWPVVGWMGDLERITREDMVEYFRVHYAPDNCILVLVGDFQAAAALDSIRAYFGPIPRQPRPPEPPDSEPAQRGERRVAVHYPAQNVTFMIGYKAPAARDPDLPALQVLGSVLGDGESSRLHQALVYDKQIALFAGTDLQGSLEPTLFQVYAQLKPGQSAAAGLAAVDEVLDRLVREGPTARELQKAKNLLEAGYVRSLKTNNGVGQRLGYYEHVYGDYHAMFEVVDRYRAVTAEDCRRVAKKYFDPLQRTVSELVPESDSGVAPSAAP